ncbi:MAG: cytochrome-c peroxidase [Polyangiaceae bacterium]|nr:cytochrome-c peroxidase [Polyangiaceae bacterium]
MNRFAFGGFGPLVALSFVAFVGACDDGYEDDYFPPNPPPQQCVPSTTSGVTCCEGPNCDCEALGTCANQTVVRSSVTPKPLSGGTLLVTRSGRHAVVSDPDRDRILTVDIEVGTVTRTLVTPEGAEPGRAIEALDGRVFVVLRSSGQILSFDPTVGDEPSLTSVCAAPRGLSLGPASTPTPSVLVACAGGELVTLSAAAAPAILQTTILDPDLRDVVASGDAIYVSHFRSAAIDVLDSALQPIGRVTPPPYVSSTVDTSTNEVSTFEPTVAWRMIPRAEGGVWVVHQQSKSSTVVVPTDETVAGSYGFGDCASTVVHAAVTGIEGTTILNAPYAGSLLSLALPVDIAASSDGVIAVVDAANGLAGELGSETVLAEDGCRLGVPGFSDGTGPESRIDFVGMEPVAVAYTPDNDLLVQLREPAALAVHSRLTGLQVELIELGGENRLDTGYLMFHADADFGFRGVVCASCHPEGGDDGHVWHFDTVGARRTQSLAGGITDTAPFHWEGELADIGALMDDVFVRRMGGMPQSQARKAAIAEYVGSLPAVPQAAGLDAAAIERGRAVFDSKEAVCTDCHTGPKLTSVGSYDVGTGSKFQVPSLVGLGMRAPYMHDGCATSIEARFDPVCGGGDEHGKTSHLTPEELTDLSTYLRSL